MSLNTPWGPAQSQHQIADGVIWVSTAGHGGLMVKQAVAGIELSAKAIECAHPGQFGYWVCFEEDCSYAVAFHEKPEWDRVLRTKDLKDTRMYANSNPHPLDSMGKNMKAWAVQRMPELEAFLNSPNEDIAAYHAKTVKAWNPEYFGLPNICAQCNGEFHGRGSSRILCAKCESARRN